MEKSIRSKVLIVMTAVILVVATMTATASAAENIYKGYPIDTSPESEIRPLMTFDSCPVPGCGGLVVLECSGTLASDSTLASFACSFSSHNNFDNCKMYNVIYYNEGRCNSCNAPLSYLVSHYGYTNTSHHHTYKHVYSTGNGHYATEYIGTCFI